jgi:hypothetical protein
MKTIDFNNAFLHGLCLIGGYIDRNENNTINNYDTSYKIIDNNTIKIKLKNYYEKRYFIIKIENDFISLFCGNDFINCCKFQ